MIAKNHKTGSRTSRAGQLITLAMVSLLGVGCATEPPPNRPKAPVALPREKGPLPVVPDVPIEDLAGIDMDALERTHEVALGEGNVAARVFLEGMVSRGLDVVTSTLIESHLAWLDGDIDRSQRLLSAVEMSGGEGAQVALAERQRRRTLAGEWLAAAQLAHTRFQLSLASRDIKDELWSALMHLSDNQLRSEMARAEGTDWRAWLELNQAYRTGREAVRSWLATHPGHPAIRPMPAGLDAWLNARPPRRVAVMLPLSGRLQQAGEAVLEGALASLYTHYRDSGQRPQLITIDTELFPDAIAAYKEAIRQDADAVIGPLTKSGVQALGSLRRRPVPVLALNRPEALPPSEARRWSALSLAPEDEARQIARLAFGRGLRRAVVVHPDTDWGRRMESALAQTWRGLGGQITTVAPLVQEPSSSEQISSAVGGALSEQRIKAVEDAFEAPVESRPRRRQDFDVIFLLAPDPAQARSLRPLLVYHYSGEIPVFAPSAVHAGQHSLRDRDLSDVNFVETPAVLDAVRVDRYTRLTALGQDAMQMLDHRAQAEATQVPLVRAQTGLLHRLANGEVERELVPVTFAGDRVKPL